MGLDVTSANLREGRDCEPRMDRVCSYETKNRLICSSAGKCPRKKRRLSVVRHGNILHFFADS